jgi:hypothetical protein
MKDVELFTRKIAEIDGFHVSAFLFFHQRRNDVKVLMTAPLETEE